MSLALNLLAAVLPNAPTDYKGIGEANGWPVKARCAGHVALEPIPGTDCFLVLNPFTVTVTFSNGKERTITTGKRFDTDCGTIPRRLRSIEELSPTRWADCYVPHDDIFVRRKYDDGTPIGLQEADWILLLLLYFSGAPPKERTVIYRGVRMGSWWVWYSRRVKESL